MVKCKTMEMIYEARRQRLAQLIDERFGGSQTGFGAAVGLAQDNVNRRLYHVHIGEKLARSIEEKLKLPYYWLDGLHVDFGRRKKPRVPVSRAAAPIPAEAGTAGGTPKTQTKAPTERRKPAAERRLNGDRRQADLNEAA